MSNPNMSEQLTSASILIPDLATEELSKSDVRTPRIFSKLLRFSQDQKTIESAFAGIPDLICLSHLRWDFVYQRPQHLLSRCAQERRVFVVEEALYDHTEDDWWLELSRRECGVWVAVPHLPQGVSQEMAIAMQQSLIDALLNQFAMSDYILWYYTPMALAFTHHLNPLAIVYDCMDELSAFRGAPQILRDLEAELFKRADVVFTGGQSLYEAKQHQHRNVHAFPSSIEVAHFAQARTLTDEPADQAGIPHPRLGFCGVIDERLDIELLDGVAQACPDWHFVMIGPVVKIDPADLPQHANIHYLGSKNYQELPKYMASWDVAMLPFARNEATRFISPTKTPEYLAAGRGVVSTSIRDVVRPYGQANMVHIADTVDAFVAAVEQAMLQTQQDAEWLNRVDTFLAQNSWDRTWAEMSQQIQTVVSSKSTLLEKELEKGTGNDSEQINATPSVIESVR